MKERLKENLIDSIYSVMPITCLALVFGVLLHMSFNTMLFFIVSSILLIIGITLFTSGADISMIPIGENMGKTLVTSGKKWLVLLMSFIIGIVITIAEPDLTVLASQLTSIPNIVIILSVGIGVGLFLLIAVFRIFKNISFSKIFVFSLIIIFSLLCFVPKKFIPVAFDSGGVTTGPMGVPLIVAFGCGLTIMMSRKNKDDSFGLCGICSLGPILMVLILGLVFKTDSSYDMDIFLESGSLLSNLISNFLHCLKNVAISLLPIIVLFSGMQLIKKNISKVEVTRIIVGIIITFFGLTIFLTGVNLGYLKMGYYLGSAFIDSSVKYLLIPFGMVLGFIIINAEPAVKVLNKQISDLTGGSISGSVVNVCLSVSVCLAIGLSILKIFFSIPIIYILLPGYVITALLTFKSSKIFTAIAIDSGGAVSGPLTTSFLLPICIGACVSLGGNIYEDAFGVVALVSMMPLITIQLLGIYYNYKINKKYSENFDETIIDYRWE